MEVWLVIALMAAGAVLALLHAIAAMVRQETHVHDLRVRVAELRLKYAKELRDLAQHEAREAADSEPSKKAA